VVTRPAPEQVDAALDRAGKDDAQARGAKSLRYAAHKASLRCNAKTALAILNRMPEWAGGDIGFDPRLRSHGVWGRLLAIVERGA
jgi:hypothetical protein